MTTTQITTIKNLIKGMSADVRNIKSEDWEALDSMRRTLNAMSEVIDECELDGMPEILDDEARAA